MESINSDSKFRYETYFKNYFEGARHFKTDSLGNPLPTEEDKEGELYFNITDEESRELENFCHNDINGVLKFSITESSITMKFNDHKRKSRFCRKIKLDTSEYARFKLEPINLKYEVIATRDCYTSKEILDKLEKLFIEKAFRFQYNRAPNRNLLYSIHYPDGIKEIIIINL